MAKINEILKTHKLLAEYSYEKRPTIKGYNMRTLYVNVGDKKIVEKTVSQEMKKKFIGGKGFGLKLLWDATKPTTKWNDPENEINMAVGPIGGTTNYPGSGKSLVVTISPQTDIPIDSNVGGFFGPFVKFSGFDALELQGKADKDVIVFIDGDNGKIYMMEAADEHKNSHILGEELIDMFAENEEEKPYVSTVTTGAAAEHALIAMLNYSLYDRKRKCVRFKQAGRGGIGRVFRDKKILALVVKYSGTRADSNNPVDLGKIQETGLKLHNEIIKNDDKQCNMRVIGTAHLNEIMNEFDLLPVKNFKFGNHKDAGKIHSKLFIDNFMSPNKADGCWYGCTMACAKVAENFELRTGPYKGSKVPVDGPEYETVGGCGSNICVFDPAGIIEINFYCDTYGIDTISFGTSTAFAMECFEYGILNKERTGGLDLTWGNFESVMELLHQMARGEGFGVVVGQGVKKMKEHFAAHFGADKKFLDDIGMENKGLEYSQYVSKESLAQQGGYAFTNKGPQHDEAWLIFMDMVRNQIPTFEKKAEALHYFPMFRTWFGLQGLCKLPWNDIEPEDNAQTAEPAKVPEHVQNYCDIYEAITGEPLSKEELILQSERVYNFQRILNIRLGKGLREHDYSPYRAMGPVTVEEYESRQERYDKQLLEKVGVDPKGKTSEEKVAIMRKFREDQYEQLKDAVYARRGWTKNGVPTIEHLKKIGMDLPELIEVVKKHL